MVASVLSGTKRRAKPPACSVSTNIRSNGVEHWQWLTGLSLFEQFDHQTYRTKEPNFIRFVRRPQCLFFHFGVFDRSGMVGCIYFPDTNTRAKFRFPDLNSTLITWIIIWRVGELSRKNGTDK
jgi:hypothetical protein